MAEEKAGVEILYSNEEDVVKTADHKKTGRWHRKTYRRIISILLILCVFLTGALGIVLFKSHFFHKAAARFGWIEKGAYGGTDYAVSAWKSCLSRMNYDCDVVFFGDSITRGADFREFFNGVEICNRWGVHRYT